MRFQGRSPGRSSPSRFPATWVAGLVLICALGGCTPARSRLGAIHQYSTLDGTAEEEATEPERFDAGPGADAATSPTLEPLGEEMRPGSPEHWGREARLAVGREFDPLYFEPGTLELTPAAARQVIDYGQWLTANPHVWITLAGHAGRQETVEFAYNLGMARALLVRERLISLGVDARRLFVLSYGSEWPAVEAETREAEQLNARVEVTGFVAPLAQPAPPPESIAPGAAPAVQEAPPPLRGHDIP
ncbi:MAG: Outer membrane lipoprotein Omp16 precursor [candidate division BRC1 bacterium ADurb.BinA292]|nr:MAG: Outer membrane lipoprotein Omp16 precursor [candidate division BRC1 bacterium ADurb.BinA292]